MRHWGQEALELERSRVAVASMRWYQAAIEEMNKKILCRDLRMRKWRVVVVTCIIMCRQKLKARGKSNRQRLPAFRRSLIWIGTQKWDDGDRFLRSS
jgi:hypothetical protein